MKTSRFLSTIATMLLVGTTAIAQDGKPLKVYILAGQSNMEGHAQTRTFPAIAKDPKTAEIYKEIVDADGKPVVCDNVWISYSYGDFFGKPIGKKAGKLTAGYGSQHHVGTGKIGPELTFGITMQKHVNEPILLIKNAWGGKSLHTDFRPPSAGAAEASERDKKKFTSKGKTLAEWKAERAKLEGQYYRLMMAHVKEVLADPSSVYPGYDPKNGFELAGFVWFQGFNDMVGPYPAADPKTGRKGAKDFSEYSRLLSCFIRDVRKDLNAPNLPFVVGVLGCEGKNANANTLAFRDGMAVPAKTAPFKGNVINVFTENYWPTELDAVLAKSAPFKKESKAKQKERINEKMTREERSKLESEINAEMRNKMEAALSEEELFLLDNGISNGGFHYYGSAKFFAQIGKAFAEALMTPTKPKPFSFGAIADCQYCATPGNGVRKYAISDKKLQDCVTYLNTQDLAFVVHLGDFIDRDYESFDVVKPIYDQLKAPHYHVLGNHDFSVADKYKPSVFKKLDMPAPYYHMTVSNWRFVILDGNDVSLYRHPKNSPGWQKANAYREQHASKKPTWNGAVGEQQLAWLRETLADADKKGESVAIFCHFPVYPANSHNLWNADEVIAILEAHPSVKAYINGHNHKGNYGIKNGIHYLTLKGMVDTEETAFAVISAEKGQLKITGHGRVEDRTLAPLR